MNLTKKQKNTTIYVFIAAVMFVATACYLNTILYYFLDLMIYLGEI